VQGAGSSKGVPQKPCSFYAKDLLSEMQLEKKKRKVSREKGRMCRIKKVTINPGETTAIKGENVSL